MPEPKNVKELQSFLAEITVLLQDLVKDNIPFIWGQNTPKPFIQKQEIQHAPLLAYYDPTNSSTTN